MGRRAVEAQVTKDPATLRTTQISAGVSATGPDVLEHLKEIERTVGLPLVWQTDNGGCNLDAEVQRYLKKKKVIHLRNCPRTPEHNPHAERGIRELKEVSGLGKGVVLVSVEEALERLLEAREVLDGARLRPSRGFHTACELASGLVPGHNVTRARFYKAARKAIRKAVQGACSARQARLKEREAIYAVLESFGLVSRHRGGLPAPASNG